MLDVHEARSRILSQTETLPSEEVAVIHAPGRVLAADVIAPLSVPPFDNSAMDGFALRSADGVGPLQIVGASLAGAPFTGRVGEGQAVRITTGAAVPEGADAVQMVENTNVSEAGVQLIKKVRPGQNIRLAGQDLQKDEVAPPAGLRVSGPAAGLLAGLGLQTVAVGRQPRIWVLSTGDELVFPGQPLGHGQIYGSNGVMLAAMSTQSGAQVLAVKHLPDVLEATVSGLKQALQADVVLLSGGVSVGEHDFVKAAMETVGLKMGFWKVAMKPGKPLAFAEYEHADGRKTLVFGLPGNPASSAVTFVQFVRPALLKMQGATHCAPPTVNAIVDFESDERPGRTKFVRVSLKRTGRGLVASQVGITSSGAMRSMAMADGLLVIRKGAPIPRRGDSAPVQVLPGWATDAF